MVGKAVKVAAGIGATTLGAGLATAAWTQVERRSPVLRRFHVPVPVPPSTPTVRILHISDLHLFPGQEWLVQWVRDLAQEDFDFVVSTGDNFGAQAALPMLREAYQPLLDYPGAFVLGSNDYYSPRAKPWISYLSKRLQKRQPKRNVPDLPWFEMVSEWIDSGWIDLSNQGETTSITTSSGHSAALALVGVDDPHIKRDRMPALPDGWDNPEVLRLGLTHAPYQRVLNEFTTLGVHVAFAGHTHGGQLCVPGYGALVTNCDVPRRYAKGLHQWGFGGDSCTVHISAGLGTAMYAPVRFSCRPEASLLTLTPA
ncbi:MAG: metallophosphoesterase [Actinomycetaceae bacterium]|nr:metallophosphoesterase [Actinomycetaceae bacterium]